MAKKDKGAKKAERVKTDKSAGGLKMPKALRNSGLSLAGLLESPVAREILASVLTAAATALASSKTARQEVADAGAATAAATEDAAREGARATKDLTLAAVDVVAGAARHVLPSLTGSGQENEDTGTAGAVNPDPQAKKGRQRDKPSAH